MKAKARSGSKASSPSFPIVGIGASAGGLNALHCFVGALPKKFGFAVVFMQHLSTQHKSLLPELLRNRKPDIGINEIADGHEVLPGRLYLCPPGADVSIRNGVFHVAFSPQAAHVHLPIDEFFISLAEEARERAIAVILSGAGTDGARGIQAIRDAGGTVFVQDPAAAEFPAMPHAAIATGQADGVFSAENIARQILKLRGRGAPPEGPVEVITPEEFETFYRLLHEKTGHRFNHYKKNVLSRRIRRRMYLRGVSSVREYATMLAEKDSEAASLAGDLMIGVTSFFRDRLAWKALKIEVIGKLAAADEDQPLRVWTPACATGEEAYSIAMMLRHECDLAGRRREIQVFATDVNDVALDKAREGKYPGSIIADVPPDYMRKFFTCSDDGLFVVIGKETRESVVFAKQDLLTDPPFSRLDLVICRNLLIYLEPEAQEKCIALFHYALRDGGYLFLGNAESAERISALFKPLGHKKCRVYQKTETKTPSRLSLSVPFASERASVLPVRASAHSQQSVTEFIQHALLEESGPAAVAVNQHHEIVYSSGPTHRYLRQPRGAPTQNLLELLPEDMRNRIRGALYRAGQEARPVSIRAIIPDDDERKRQITVRIAKLGENLFLIMFRPEADKKDSLEQTTEVAAAVDDAAVRQLEGELSATRAELQSHIEQLKSLNEELQSSNEELQAANEELETSREELQSLNEELSTVNSQLQEKIEEQEETNNDLNNFLASANIPTVFLDTQFRVRRFTPAMSRLLKLIPSDVGRPIIDMSQEGLGPDLILDAREVLEHLAPVKKEVRINGEWYIRAALPYRTSDNRIEGVVITYSDVTELKRAEERTIHLASFPQLNPNPVCEVDASGSVTFCNPATEKILEDLGMDKRDFGVFVPSDLHSVVAKWDRKSEASLYRELDIRNRVFAANIYLNPHFKVARIYAFDITEHKKAEEALRESEAQLRLLADSIPNLAWWANADGYITWYNRRWYEYTDTTPEEMEGWGWQRVHDPLVLPKVLERWKASIATGEPFDMEFPLRGADGIFRPFLTRVMPLNDSAGKVLRWFGTNTDITERKRAEELLRRAADFDEAVMKSLGEGLYTIDEKGLVSSMNPAAQELFGWTFDELRGKKMHDMTHHHYRDGREFPSSECAGFQVLMTGVPLKNHEDVFIHKDGTFFDVTYSIAPIRDSSGKINGLVVVFTDITERRKAESEIRRYLEELRTSNEELMRFNSAAVGRELRMIELKKEINELCGRAGLPPRYPLDFEKEG